MGFDASKAIEKLDYDFRPYVNASGTTPEPSSSQMTDFQFAIKAMAEKTEGVGIKAEDQEALLGFVQDMSREDVESMDEELIDALTALTTGRPSKEDLKELQEKSFRHFRAYCGWLMGEIMSPEASSAVTNRSQEDRNGASRTLRSVRN